MGYIMYYLFPVAREFCILILSTLAKQTELYIIDIHLLYRKNK